MVEPFVVFVISDIQVLTHKEVELYSLYTLKDLTFLNNNIRIYLFLFFLAIFTPYNSEKCNINELIIIASDPIFKSKNSSKLIQCIVDIQHASIWFILTYLSVDIPIAYFSFVRRESQIQPLFEAEINLKFVSKTQFHKHLIAYTIN